MTVTLTARTAEVVLYQGDDRARIAELLEVADEAVARRKLAKGRPQLLAGDDVDAEVESKVAEYNAAVEKAKERALVVVLTAVGYRAWRSLKKAHPPREDEAEDKLIGQNYDTFPLPAILACWQDESVPDREAQVERFCEADFLLVLTAALRLNTAQGFDPKAVTASDVMLASDAT